MKLNTKLRKLISDKQIPNISIHLRRTDKINKNFIYYEDLIK